MAKNPIARKKKAGSNNLNLASSYVKELNLDTKKRYFTNLKVIIQKSWEIIHIQNPCDGGLNCLKNPGLWPESFFNYDLHKYLIERSGIYNKENMNVFKTLGGYSCYFVNFAKACLYLEVLEIFQFVF